MSCSRCCRSRASSDSSWVGQKPFREVLFGAERLEEYARSLAVARIVTPRPTKDHPFSRRLTDNGAHRQLPRHRPLSGASPVGRQVDDSVASNRYVASFGIQARKLARSTAVFPARFARSTVAIWPCAICWLTFRIARPGLVRRKFSRPVGPRNGWMCSSLAPMCSRARLNAVAQVCDALFFSESPRSNHDAERRSETDPPQPKPIARFHYEQV